MKELNHTQGLVVIEENNFDTLTMINQGEAFSLGQVDEEGELHSIILGPEQAVALITQLTKFLG